MTLQYKHKTIVGFLDSDGTFTIRILERKNFKLGFSVLASFKQVTRNIDVLEPISRELNAQTLVTTKRKKNNTYDTCLNIVFNTAAGKKLLKILKKFPPLNVIKRKDYLISIKVYEFSKNRTFPELKGYTCEDQEKIGSIATVFLIYNTTNESDAYSLIKKRKKSLRTWIKFLRPTKKQYLLGLRLGKNFLKHINLNVNNLKRFLNQKNIKLAKAYIVGYSIGDGSFQVNFRCLPNKLAAEPSFTITESINSIDLLYAVKSTFGSGSVALANKNKRTCRYKLSGWARSVHKLIPVFQSYRLPRTKQKQFNIFKKACLMAYQRNHLTKKGFLQLLDIAWPMYEQGRLRKMSKHQLIDIINAYFSLKPQIKSKLHIKLIKKFANKRLKKRNGNN